jgi:repressor LexA
VREVRDAVGFSAVESARAHLEALVAEGRLEKESGESRGYRLPSAGRRGTHPPVLVPLLGRVAAGAPILAAEHTEGWLSVQPRRAGEALFALRVRGDSMVNAGILDGDIVVVRSRETAEDGRIVVAQVGDGEQAEATVKRFRRGRGGRVELHPENAAYPVLVPPPGNVRILGQVVEVRRFLEGGEGAITGHDAPPGSWPAGVREDGPDGAGREDGPDGPDGEDRANDPGGRGGPDRRDTGASPAGQRPRDGGTRP